MRSRLLSLGLLLLAAACGNNPVAPPADPFAGRWAGALPIRLPDGDPSSVVITLDQNANALAGTLETRDAVKYNLAGFVMDGNAVLEVGGLPGTSTCAAIELYVTATSERTSRRLTGYAGGRCYGTIAGSFTLLPAQ